MRLCHQAIRAVLLFVALVFAATADLARPAYATPIALTDLLEKDPLGNACIAPSTPNHTYASGITGLRALLSKPELPRVCLPNPCDRVLTRRELSDITGTDIILAWFSEEWDFYYARYADTCVAEVVFPTPTVDPIWANRVPVPGLHHHPHYTATRTFWEPVLTRARITQRLAPPVVRHGLPVRVGLIDPPDWGIPLRPKDAPVVINGAPKSIRMLTSAGGSVGIEKPTGAYEYPPADGPFEGPIAPPLTSPSPSPVPIPAPGLLLFAALAMLAHKKRRVTA